MLRVDLHMHTRFSPDSAVTPESMVARCRQVGLTCIAVTDHNSLEGARRVGSLAPFTVIPGEEIRSTDGEIIGLFLQEEVHRGLTGRETVRRIKEQGALVSIPHPFDRVRRGVIDSVALEELLPQVDIIEVFNARNTFARDNRLAADVATRHGLVPSAVSDAHSLGELGHTYVEMPDFDGTPEGFLESLRRGRIMARRASPLVHLITTFNKLRRRRWS